MTVKLARPGSNWPLLCTGVVILALAGGCGDTSKPSAHEPDTHDVEPAAPPPQPVAKPAPQPAPPPVVSSNPPAVSHSTSPPAPPQLPSTVDPLDPANRDRPGAANLRPVEGPQSFPEIAPPTAPEPPLPPGVTVMEAEQPATKTSVSVQVESGDRVTIETRNVKRMRIHRNRLGVSDRRSAVLRIDDQVIEWTRDAEVVELDRTRNGIWTVARTGP